MSLKAVILSNGKLNKLCDIVNNNTKDSLTIVVVVESRQVNEFQFHVVLKLHLSIDTFSHKETKLFDITQSLRFL
jgi:hypothetical protein